VHAADAGICRTLESRHQGGKPTVSAKQLQRSTPVRSDDDVSTDVKATDRANRSGEYPVFSRPTAMVSPAFQGHVAACPKHARTAPAA
jgi:hypothetical protein